MKSHNGIYHLYLRARDKGIIFYTLEDRLVYYTICAVKAKESDVLIAAAAIMFSHVHFSAVSDCAINIREFMQRSGTTYARLFNHRYGRTGRLLDRRPGQSFKASLKGMRSNIIYVFNNHVEKGLCKKAVEERWSFLAYADNPNPFSSPVDEKRSSKLLLKACRLVDRRVKKRTNLNYKDLDRILPKLTEGEKEQFVDYVIQRYCLIDFSMAKSLFGNFEALKLATESTTGGEYDIKEEHNRNSDRAYVELVKKASEQGFLNKIFKMTTAEKLRWIEDFARYSSASFSQLRKFFHENFKTE